MTADELAAAPHYLYWLLDPSDAVLYVGCSVDPEARLRAHRSDQPWSDLIARQVVDGPFDRADCLRREAAAIAADLPRFNVAHNPNPERCDGPSDEVFLYVQRRVCLSGRSLGRAFWNGDLPLNPTDAEVYAFVHSLELRYRAYPCPWAGCGCFVIDEVAA